MSNWFDVIGYVFEWCKDTYYVPIEIMGYQFTFTILGVLLIPFLGALTILVIRHIKALVD